jgi:amino acid transporter/nucleotide-binding universal stress UspA family protein
LSIPASEARAGPPPHDDLRRLGWLLAWAVVFCDIGTSIYYVPGILYKEPGIGDLAPFFVTLTIAGFVLLASKYVEVSWRNPEGGCVVTVATKAFGPFLGAVGGMLIIVDYFLTAAISSVSAFQYIGSVVPFLSAHVTVAAAIGLVGLAILNIIGIRESAVVAFWMAIAALTVNLVLAGTVLAGMTPEQWEHLWTTTRTVRTLPWTTALVGFGGAWLAFSGLESISQLSPAMVPPVRRTATRAMALVVLTIGLTSPLRTSMALAGLAPGVKELRFESFMSALGETYGGPGLAWSVVLTASALLLFAANTALIGGYHVFLALARNDYLPKALARRNRKFGTPHIGIVFFTVVVILVIWRSAGRLEFLGHLYSFGLLGAFTFTSLGIDVIRWRERARGPSFWIGLVTTAMVATAWAVNIVHKREATLFGGSVVALGVLVAVGIRRDWVIRALNQIPWIAGEADRRRLRAEWITAERSPEIVSLETALEASALEPSRTLIAIRDLNPRLVDEAVFRARGAGDTAIFVLGVTEWPGLFSGEQLAPDPVLVDAFQDAAVRIRAAGLTPIPIWRLSHDAARSIADAAKSLGVNAVMVGVSQRSGFVHMLRGSVLKGLHRMLPGDEILIHSVG